MPSTPRSPPRARAATMIAKTRRRVRIRSPSEPVAAAETDRPQESRRQMIDGSLADRKGAAGDFSGRLRPGWLREAEETAKQGRNGSFFC